ncbi:putative adenosylcobinamide kinase/adenosylcobinamide-phosphate guanylyltransferase [Selenomonas ruminantium subsp. lactilytica TAM6421]|uniref:Adenosylcobinamide kinase n=1 Tax=Selenomonas ruminantium subsp. lactilytica (strain NBRC 103574 / TAM6421) TaxID=927704 RepID=I0GPE6_SELRL|nr:bifunctional adenosylcobinamide kinase/adenosylcobinamide-phosphate guanylyltransferase [Selenomonas ruminantium]BAL82633.1 putative adenosylcobinamide kinase/adenosylcobinamide-phosphate guanylyltransferase [Selenomonas ruminantium subsp. lactilytica TAM6421]
MAGKIILVTGGARSGKSAFAERLAAESGAAVGYIATAQIYDEEMRYRVKLHQQRRPENWQTFEAPFAAEQAIVEAAVSCKVLLFDCITLYLSNMLCAIPAEELTEEGAYGEMNVRIDRLLQAAQKAALHDVTTIFVTNEVGAGIVPENRLARFYRDVSGLANQKIAAAAEDVYAVLAGIPVNLKKINALLAQEGDR